MKTLKNADPNRILALTKKNGIVATGLTVQLGRLKGDMWMILETWSERKQRWISSYPMTIMLRSDEFEQL